MKLRLEIVSSKVSWETFLLTHAPEALFQSWDWGMVQEATGEVMKRYGMYEGETLVGLAQIGVVRAKRGAFLHVRHGPVWDTQTQSRWHAFFSLMKDMAKREGAWFVRVSPRIANSEHNRDLLKAVGARPAPVHEVDAERCWVLDLDRSEEELLLGMRKTTRYEVRLAQKSDITLKVSTDVFDLKHFYSLYEQTSKRHGFVAHKAISEEFTIFGKEGNAQLFLGFHKKTPVAATLVLFYGEQAIYHHGASVPSKIPVSYLLQWEAIKEAKKRGMKVYNFYGIAPEYNPNHPWRGITLFKKGFGGREVNYIHAHDYAVSPLYMIPWTIETVRRKQKGY
jgi:peptidoglycan pentaglycine glycine transferase (the first glycine)